MEVKKQTFWIQKEARQNYSSFVKKKKNWDTLFLVGGQNSGHI